MRRVCWTAGIGPCRPFSRFEAQDTVGDVWFTALCAIWASGIGFGLGSIFDQKTATKYVVIYWAATLTLVGPLLAFLIDTGIEPFPSVTWQIAVGTAGVLVSLFLGTIFGNAHLRRLQRSAGSGVPSTTPTGN